MAQTGFMLNEKQERFCKEYVIDLNATQAAIRAGYSENTANEQASRLLANVNIQARVKELQDGISERLEITADMVVSELWALGSYNVKDFVNEGDNTIKNISDIDRGIAKAIVGVKVTERTVTQNGVSDSTITTEMKFADKRAALVDVGRHLGIFEKDNKQKVQPVDMSALSDDDLAKLAELQGKVHDK